MLKIRNRLCFLKKDSSNWTEKEYTLIRYYTGSSYTPNSTPTKKYIFAGGISSSFRYFDWANQQHHSSFHSCKKMYFEAISIKDVLYSTVTKLL
ncbi:MAG: hypothetical protein KAI79_02350 [Bacteroidales bacterium]|nr:hypothetical protein [Bacteroidales bacterium]